MLYDGAIRTLLQARYAIEQRDAQGRYAKLKRVSEIVLALQSCLDFDAAPAQAKRLFDFYAQMDMRILGLHRSCDLAACDALVEELRQMRAFWDRLDRSGVAADIAATGSAGDDPAQGAAGMVTVSA